MFDIGRIVMKIAGRDAGREAIIVDTIDSNYVLIDGNVRRKKCNVNHLEPSHKKIDIKKGAAHEEIAKKFEELGYGVWSTKPKQVGEKPVKVRKEKVEEPAEKKPKTAKKKIVKDAEVTSEKKAEPKKK